MEQMTSQYNHTFIRHQHTEPSKALILHIFDTDFVRQGMISNYVSLEWTEDYYGRGSFLLVCVDDAENIKLLQQGRYVAQKDLDTAMVIRQVKYDTLAHQIVVRGFTTLDIIGEQRIIYRTIKVTNVEAGMRQIISDNMRGLPYQTIAPLQGIPDVFETQFTGDKCIEACTSLGQESHIGFKNVFDHRNGRHIFTPYKGTDYSWGNVAGNPPRVFSAEFKNLENMIIIDDMSIFKNVAYVAGAGEGEARIWVEVGTAMGLDRFELFVDARDLQPDEDDKGLIDIETGLPAPSPEYEKVLIARGIKKLNEHIRVKTFIGEISQAGFGIEFGLGDVISCKSDKYGVRLDSRILQYSRVRENNITKLVLTMGEPQITLLQAVRL